MTEWGTGPRFRRHREDFDCLHCGTRVHSTGYTNHCPHCLWSRHVDIAPGDRAAQCRGAMEPVAALHERGETVVLQRCVRCGHTWRNRAAPGDDRAVILALFGRPVPEVGRGHRRRPRSRARGDGD